MAKRPAELDDPDRHEVDAGNYARRPPLDPEWPLPPLDEDLTIYVIVSGRIEPFRIDDECPVDVQNLVEFKYERPIESCRHLWVCSPVSTVAFCIHCNVERPPE